MEKLADSEKIQARPPQGSRAFCFMGECQRTKTVVDGECKLRQLWAIQLKAKERKKRTMKGSTEKILMGAFALDDTISPNVAKDAITVLRTGGAGSAAEEDRSVDGTTAAAMLGISRRSVQNYANAGLIRRIGGKATKTRTRFSIQSIREYINGGVINTK